MRASSFKAMEFKYLILIALCFYQVCLMGNSPPVILSNGGGATSEIVLPENKAVVTTVRFSDPDGSGIDVLSASYNDARIAWYANDGNGSFGVMQTITTSADGAGSVYAADLDGDGPKLSVSGGADAALFSVDAQTNQLLFKQAPPLEQPADANGDNVYEVEVKVTDSGGLSGTQFLLVRIYDAFPQMEENQTNVTKALPASVDASGSTFSIHGGRDAALFSVNAATGLISFRNPPDYEKPEDNGTDNVYEVKVRASEGNFSVDQAFWVQVKNRNEPPIISMPGGLVGGAGIIVNENTSSVGRIKVFDPDRQVHNELYFARPGNYGGIS